MNIIFANLPRRTCWSGLIVVCSLLLGACSSGQSTADSSVAPVDYGVLVMAHGGGTQWNASVEQAISELRSEYPVSIAFGMADAGSMERAVRQLESEGVAHVGVVRMFISGESWYERTEQILGIEDGAPSKRQAQQAAVGQTAMRMPMGFWQIDSDLAFHMSPEGLADAEEMDRVLLDRISALSRQPDDEVVVVLAHGPGDDAENQRWIDKISQRTQLARDELALHAVRTFTLREDWQDKRELAEQQIRDYIAKANAAGRQALVIPYRVQGFGPYHEVLAGLDYRADETGLVPHDNVIQWIQNQADSLRAEATDHAISLLAASP